MSENMKAYKGIAAFAALNPKFPTKRVLKAYPKDIERPATSILLDLFGDDWTFVQEFCEKFADRPHLIQFHLCFRNPVRGLPRKARQVQKAIQVLGNQHTQLIICPVLEDACTNKQWKRIAKAVRKATNNEVPIVRNPHSNQDNVQKADLHEAHGRNPKFKKPTKFQIYNPDGLSVDMKDGDKYFNRCSIKEFKKYKSNSMFAWFVWYAPLQGFRNAKDWTDKPPIESRKYKISRKAVRTIRNKIL